MSQYIKLTTTNSKLYVNSSEVGLNSLAINNGLQISAEIIRTQSVETILSNNISTEISRAKSIEPILSSNISNELSRTISSGTILSNNISTEISRGLSIGSILSSNISTEITRATTSENIIVSRIQNIVSGAPTTLDTIGEIAIALSNNPSIIDIISTSISNETSRAILVENILSSNISTEVFLLSDLSFNSLITFESNRALTSQSLIIRDTSIEINRAVSTERIISNTVLNYNNNSIIPVQNSVTNYINRTISTESSLSTTLSLVDYKTIYIESSNTVINSTNIPVVRFLKSPILNYTPLPTVVNPSNANDTITQLNYLGGSLQRNYIVSLPSTGFSAEGVNTIGVIQIPPGNYFVAIEVLFQNTTNSELYENSLILTPRLNSTFPAFNPFNITNFRYAENGFAYRNLRNVRGDTLWNDPGFVSSVTVLSGFISNAPTYNGVRVTKDYYLIQNFNIQTPGTSTNPIYIHVSYQLTRLG